MPFCATCGSQVEGRFCGKCGATVVAGGAAPPPPPPGVSPGGPQYSAGPQYAASPVSAPMADNVASFLCYVLGFITGIIFLVMEPYSRNPLIRFHAFQSIFLSVAMIAIRIIFTMALPFSVLSFGLWAMVWTLLNLAFFGLWIYMMVMAYTGKPVVLPVIGPLAQKQAQS